MRPISTDKRSEIITNIIDRIDDVFNTPKRERFYRYVMYLNGNMPSTNFYSQVDKPIDLSFGFSINIRPKYLKRFKEGEIERLTDILVNEVGEYGQVYFRKNVNQNNDTTSVDLVMFSIRDTDNGLVELNKHQQIF